MKRKQLYAHDILTDERTPIADRVRLDVKGGYLEIVPDPHGPGLQIRASGSLASRIVVRPRSANEVIVEGVRG